ncbi:MAG: DNA-formamidopyrimidine glycosylase [Rickettsiaceae bacterium]|jgi:formamidopyrimidine-DNA glycosylase|nr:DNA-formamidopyrimidine glycosylase [Rickettsiaceae bacterium]
MPELPEVETVCRGLAQNILDTKIIRAENLRPNLRIPFPDNFSGQLKNKTIKSIHRRAKYILITLDDSSIIIAHLGMSGKMVVHDAFQNRRELHDHAVFQFDNGKEVVFNDPRRFGLITFSDTKTINQHKLIASLGVEPLENEFTGEVLHQLLHKKSTPVKLAIMDASLVVGVGNIYACEALFKSGISPTKKASEVSLAKCKTLVANIKEVLNAAIIAGGSTLRDYVQASGDSGYFQHNFTVYGRQNEPCVTCQNPINRIKQSGRSTFYCNRCQK